MDWKLELVIGKGLLGGMAPGSLRGLHLVVPDIEAARSELVARGVKVSGPVHFDAGKQMPGPDPERRDYRSFVFFEDPEGNSWVIQEVRRGAPRA